MVNELKPCPFCGGEADWFWDGINQRWQIRCEDCTAVVSCDGLEDAIEAWTRRCEDGK